MSADLPEWALREAQKIAQEICDNTRTLIGGEAVARIAKALVNVCSRCGDVAREHKLHGQPKPIDAFDRAYYAGAIDAGISIAHAIRALAGKAGEA